MGPITRSSVQAHDRYLRRADDSWLEEIDEALGFLLSSKVQHHGGVVAGGFKPKLLSCPPITADIESNPRLVPCRGCVCHGAMCLRPRSRLTVLDSEVDTKHVVPVAEFISQRRGPRRAVRRRFRCRLADTSSGGAGCG